MKTDKVRNKKPRTKFRNSYNEKKRKKNEISKQQYKNETLPLGTSFSGKSYLMLRFFSRITDPDIQKFTESSPEQVFDFKFKMEETGGEIKSLNEYENSVLNFDDILVSSNCET